VALIAVAADKGAPGVTTACVALAAVWPRPVLLAECDPAGGDLACRLPAAGGGQLDPGRGLLSLAVAGRRGIGPGQILEHTQKLSGGLDVLAGVVTAEQGAGLELLWGPAGAAMAQLPDLDVIADCGRIGADGPHYDLLASAATVVLVTRDTLAEVVRLRERAAAVTAALAGRHRNTPVAVVVIAGNRRFHAAIADVGRALGGAAGSRQAERGVAGSRQAERGVAGSRQAERGGARHGGTARVIGGLAYDPPSAEALCGAWGGRLNRSLLLRTARDVAGRLAAPLPTPVATPAGRG
jgi:MinD-like ATPase involved in chromosome partitioning or flagellar assembly